MQITQTQDLIICRNNFYRTLLTSIVLPTIFLNGKVIHFNLFITTGILLIYEYL